MPPILTTTHTFHSHTSVAPQKRFCWTAVLCHTLNILCGRSRILFDWVFVGELCQIFFVEKYLWEIFFAGKVFAGAGFQLWEELCSSSYSSVTSRPLWLAECCCRIKRISPKQRQLHAFPREEPAAVKTTPDSVPGILPAHFALSFPDIGFVEVAGGNLKSIRGLISAHRGRVGEFVTWRVCDVQPFSFRMPLPLRGWAGLWPTSLDRPSYATAHKN